MNAGDGHDLTNGVGEGELLADHPCECESSEIEDEHIFKWSELFAGTASYNAADKNEKAISPNGSDDCEEYHERELPEGAAGLSEQPVMRSDAIRSVGVGVQAVLGEPPFARSIQKD
jgi:hypothetical protein